MVLFLEFEEGEEMGSGEQVKGSTSLVETEAASVNPERLVAACQAELGPQAAAAWSSPALWVAASP